MSNECTRDQCIFNGQIRTGTGPALVGKDRQNEAGKQNHSFDVFFHWICKQDICGKNSDCRLIFCGDQGNYILSRTSN